MLNRRTLRIKVMQSLFAYEQCKEADYLLACDCVESYFEPDLNSMKVQDRTLLKEQKQVAMRIFERRFKGEEMEPSADSRITEAVEAALDLYKKQTRKDFDFLKKQTVIEVEKITTYYFSVLSLLEALADVAAADKKVNHKAFANNYFVAALRANGEYKSMVLKLGAGWDTRMDKVRGWFRDIVRQDEEYQQFLDHKAPDEEMQKSIIKHLLRKLILGKSTINDYFEEEDIRWAEDHEIIRSMVEKTLKSSHIGSPLVEIQKLSLEWEDDRHFMDELFAHAARLEPQYLDLIARNTRNWEMERLPLTDRVVLAMAISELLRFQNIPVKVTINEYIELTKRYSTPNSRQFINGILDVIAKELQQTGAIRKSGRGLIDNK
ncbi:MAG: transcription antitermination factor NusB [Cyclobacteriaceae bacterium]